MKKKLQAKKIFDLEYVQRIEPEKSHARHMADEWMFYFDVLPGNEFLSRGWNTQLKNEMEAEIKKAIETRNADFFRKFAQYIETPKEPCPIRKWVLEVHLNNVCGPDTRFTHAELVEGAKQAGFFKRMDDDSILTQLKRIMGEINMPFKNSPKNKQGEHS